MKQTIEQKKQAAKDKLKAEMAKLEVEERFHNTVGFRHVIHSRQYIAIFEVETLQDARQVMKEYPPTNKTNKLSFAAKDDIIIDTPYHITFTSPVRVSTFSKPECKIQYSHGEVGIWLKFPSELVRERVIGGTRKVTASEYHYFGGVPMAKIRQMSISTYALKDGDNVGYYGGNKVARNETAIQEFIDYIMGEK